MTIGVQDGRLEPPEGFKVFEQSQNSRSSTGLSNKCSGVADMGNRSERIDMAQNGTVPFFGGAEFPSNTMWPGRRPTSVPSGNLIHPAVWPQ